MKLAMRPLGAGGLIWLVATACGDSNSGADLTKPSNDSGGGANDTGSTGTGTGTGTAGTGTTGTGTTGMGTMGTGTTGTGFEDCPDIEPALEASCSNEGLSCAFTNCVAPNYRNDHTLTCVQGAWTLASEVECQPSCPETAPEIGSSCDAQATPGPCLIVHVCGTAYAYCSEGEWSLHPSDTATTGGSKIVVAVCPDSAPALGTECCPTHHPDTCDYSSGQGVPGAGGSDAGFAPLPGTTSATGGTGSGDATRGSADASSTGARGSSDTTSGAGATGGTGAYATCVTCDPVAMQWFASSACN